MTINPATGRPFDSGDADRLLGLADQFLEDWETHEGKRDPECIERRKEWDAIRPTLAVAPGLAELALAVASGTVDRATLDGMAQSLCERMYGL